MQKNFRRNAFFVCIFAYFTLGCMVLTVNTVMDSIITEFSWTDSRGALLITCMSMGNLVMSIFGNMLMERIGKQRTLVIFAALIAVCFALFGLVPAPGLFFVFLGLAGLAWGCINCLANTTVSELFDGSAAQLNILHAGFSVGAVLFPLLVGFTVRRGMSWHVPVLIVSGLSLVLTAFALTTKLPEHTGDGGTGEALPDFPFWKELGFYISTLTLFLYVGVETSASSWISGYLQRYNVFFEKIPAQTMVSLMWGMMLVGRLSVAAVSTKLNKRVLLIVLAGCFLLGMTGLVLFSAVTPLVILSVVVMGLGMSAMYGTTVANAQRYVAGPPLGAGIMYGAGGLGSALVPYVAGIVSDGSGLRMGMASLCVFLVLLLGMTVLSWWNAKRLAQ